MLKKETIDKIVRIENNPFIMHILNKKNLTVKDLLMIMSLCSNKFNAEKIKNLVLPEIAEDKETEKPKKIIQPKVEIKQEVVEPEVVEPKVIKTETIESPVIETKEVKVFDISEDNTEQKVEEITDTVEEPLNEPTSEAPEVTAIEETEKPKKKGGKKKKISEEISETSK